MEQQEKDKEEKPPATQPEKKASLLMGIKSVFKSKFYLIFLVVLMVTIGALGVRTYQQSVQPKLQQVTNTNTNPETLVRRSKIPNIITKATTAKVIDIKTGKAIQAARVFSIGDKTVYLSLDLNKPSINTRIDYIRYLNGRYVDHGSIKVTKADTQSLAFGWTINNSNGKRPDGKYKVATYTNGVLEKRVNYTVIKNKIANSSVEDFLPADLDYYFTSKLLTQSY